MSRSLGNDGCLSAIDSMHVFNEDSLNIFSKEESGSVEQCPTSESNCMIKEGSTWGTIHFYRDSSFYYRDQMCGKGFNLDSLHLILDSLVHNVEFFSVREECKADSTLAVCENQSTQLDSLTAFDSEGILKIPALNIDLIMYQGNVEVKTENGTTVILTIIDTLFVQVIDSVMVQVTESDSDTVLVPGKNYRFLSAK